MSVFIRIFALLQGNMDIGLIVLIALGLSFDTFAVSISTGLTQPRLRFLGASRIASTLAAFQALMPLIGYFLGSQIRPFVENYDHWIAFILLLILGGKMIIESFSSEEEIKESEQRLPLKRICWMGFATSIDALIIGFGFALMNIEPLFATIIIGIITYIVAMLGLLAGKKTGNRFGKRIEIIGGLILIGIGLKTLLSHLL